MSISTVIQIILRDKYKLEVEGNINDEIIFSFDNKIICSIGRNLKNLFKQDDKFYLTFFYETKQEFHSEEKINSIVMSGKCQSFSTEQEDDNYEVDLDSILCKKLYSHLLWKMYDVDQIFEKILENFENRNKLTIGNAKLLYSVIEMINHPSEIVNIHRDDKIMFYDFRKFMWALIPLDSTHFSLRLFLNTNYTYEEYKADLGSYEYDEPHYIDFESKVLALGNVKFFNELYTNLRGRILSIKDIFAIISG